MLAGSLKIFHLNPTKYITHSRNLLSHLLTVSYVQPKAKFIHMNTEALKNHFVVKPHGRQARRQTTTKTTNYKQFTWSRSEGCSNVPNLEFLSYKEFNLITLITILIQHAHGNTRSISFNILTEHALGTEFQPIFVYGKSAVVGQL